MTRDSERLDRQWDNLVRGRDAHDCDPLLRRLHAHKPAEPSPMFVSQVRSLIEIAAQEMSGDRPAAADRATVPLIAVADEPGLVPNPHSVRSQPGRMRGLSRAESIASAALAAALLIAMVAAVARYPFGGSNSGNEPSAIPAAFGATPSPELGQIPDVLMYGADPQRSNIQPGPGLAMLPEIVQRANVVGKFMALADGVLVIGTSTSITALDAVTLTELWSVDLDGAAYSAPTVADGRIYLGVALDTEAGGGDADENQLFALSLEDGRELWRVDGAGVYPVSPIVDGEVVYSLGVADRRFVLAGYRVTDGEPVWQTDLGPFVPCCPSIGLAFDDGILVVNGLTSADVYQPTGVAAYDAAEGRELWSHVAESGKHMGPPMIVDGLVIVNQSDYPAGDVYQNPTIGSTIAYELATGEIAWTNESTRAFWAPTSASGGVVFAGPWHDSDGGQIALLSLETGETDWKIPLPRMEGDLQTHIAPPREAAPVIVGDTIYLIGSTPPRGGISVPASLLTAIELESGTIQWMAQLEGGVVSTPIVSGGRVFILTSDAGMYVLGDSTQPMTSEETVVDLRTPVTCDAAPSQSPLLGDLPAEPSIPGVADWHQPITISQTPRDPSNVDPAVAEQIIERFKEYRACSDVDPYNSVFGFFSTDFYVRLQDVEEYWGEPEQPWAVWMSSMQEYLWLDAAQIHQLPDGRYGALVNSPAMNFYVWFVMEDGVWKIDEYHRIQADPVDPNAATPEPSPSP